MAEAGLSNREVLLAATAVNADLLGLGKELGRLEPGKYADAVLFEADPLADLANLRRIDRVIKVGVCYDPRALRAAEGGEA